MTDPRQAEEALPEHGPEPDEGCQDQGASRLGRWTQNATQALRLKHEASVQKNSLCICNPLPVRQNGLIFRFSRFIESYVLIMF